MPAIPRLRSLMSRAYALTVAAILTTFAIAGVLSWQYHKALVSRAKVQASQFALLLAEQATRTFEAVDFTLRGLEPLLEGQLTPHDPALEARLRQRSSELESVQSIRVLDAQGNEVQRSRSVATVRLIRKRGLDEKLLSEAEITIQRGNAMVEQLLAFSRRQDLRIIDANINILLRQMEGVLSRFAGAGTTLVLDLEETVPLCKLDHTQFDAALMNLVSNARDAMLSSGTIRLSTRVARDKDGIGPAFVALEVSDNGCGMDEATTKRVFEPFFTTKDNGTGLGLAQVYGFMKQIGGDVVIRSARGRGTTITLNFPARSAAREDLEGCQAFETGSSAARRLQ